MISVKLATLGLLKIKVFGHNGFNIILSMTSPTKFYHLNQIRMQMWSCDQSLVTLTFLLEKLLQQQFYKDLSRKNNSLRSVLGSSSIIWNWHQVQPYANVAKGLKIKVREFLGLIPTLGELTGKKLVSGLLVSPHPEQGQNVPGSNIWHSSKYASIQNILGF